MKITRNGDQLVIEAVNLEVKGQSVEIFLFEGASEENSNWGFSTWVAWVREIQFRRLTKKPMAWELVVNVADAPERARSLLSNSDESFLSYRDDRRHLTLFLNPYPGYKPSLLFEGSGLLADYRSCLLDTGLVSVSSGPDAITFKR